MWKRLTWLAAAAGFLMLADGATWLWGTRALAAGVDRWAAQLRGQGWTVELGSRSLGGWPFAATMSVANVKLVAGDQPVPGGFAWYAEDLTLSVSLVSPRVLQVTPEGQEHLRVAHMRGLVFTGERITGRVYLWGTGGQRADITAARMTGGLAGLHHPQDVRVDLLELQAEMLPRTDGGVRAKLDFAAHGIELPDIGRWPLGGTVGEAAASLQFVSPKLPSGPMAPAQAAAAWRDHGGTLDVNTVSLHWGPLDLRGKAKLGLDARLQPAGSGTTDVRGGADALDALVVGDVVPPGLGATAKAVLGAMSQEPGGDALRLPFVLHDSTLSVGPIPLARLNDIVW